MRRVSGVVVLCILGLLVSLFAGPSLVGPHAEFVLLELRIPRLLVGALAGAALGLSGACFQIVFNNPLATPSTVGTLAGATLGALFALVLGIDVDFFGLPVTALSAFVGALLASFIVVAVARSGRARMNDVLLAGIAISLATNALAAGLEYMADSRTLFAASRWSLGALPQVGYRGVLLMGPVVLATSIVLLLKTRALSSFMLGEEVAHAQGVDVPKLRGVILLTASLAVAVVVAWCGPIAFVGLIVPHVVRLVVGPRVRSLLPLSLLGGATFLTLCDAAARTLFPGRELPVGVVTAALGAPALVVLIARNSRQR